jgi:hypothetical protein
MKLQEKIFRSNLYRCIFIIHTQLYLLNTKIKLLLCRYLCTVMQTHAIKILSSETKIQWPPLTSIQCTSLIQTKFYIPHSKYFVRTFLKDALCTHTSNMRTGVILKIPSILLSQCHTLGYHARENIINQVTNGSA